MLRFSFLLVIAAANLSAEHPIAVSFQPLEYSCHAEVGTQILCLKTHGSKGPETWCVVLVLCFCSGATVLQPRDLVLDCLLISVKHLYLSM